MVNQKAKLIELNNEYAIFDQNGTQIGAVRQVGQSTAKKVLRLVSVARPVHDPQAADRRHDGHAGAGPHPPGQGVQVAGRGGGRRRRRDRAQIVQENMVGKIRFGLEAGGRSSGSINAENWRAWNFNIQDEPGQEVARITKTWEGLAKTMFTTADNYVVQIHRPLEDPLRSLVVAVRPERRHRPQAGQPRPRVARVACMPAGTRPAEPGAAPTVRFGSATGRWVILATVLGSGMAFLDGTVVNVALPAIAEDLDAGLSGLQWMLDAYLVTLAGLLLLGGSWATTTGGGGSTCPGMVAFTAASLLCGLAPNIELLVAARAVQGVGGACSSPAAWPSSPPPSTPTTGPGPSAPGRAWPAPPPPSGPSSAAG